MKSVMKFGDQVGDEVGMCMGMGMETSLRVGLPFPCPQHPYDNDDTRYKEWKKKEREKETMSE
jgi:hypothetical protein